MVAMAWSSGQWSTPESKWPNSSRRFLAHAGNTTDQGNSRRAIPAVHRDVGDGAFHGRVCVLVGCGAVNHLQQQHVSLWLVGRPGRTAAVDVEVVADVSSDWLNAM